MDSQIKQILEFLKTDQYVTSAHIAKAAGVSQRTAQQRLRQLDSELKGHGVRLIAKQRAGYRLEVTDDAAWTKWKEELKEQEETIPGTTAERVSFLLGYLLNHTDYMKLEELSQLFCVSRNTVTANLKQAEYILNEYNLKIDRRPKYGIRIEGDELAKRTCIVKCLLKEGMRFSGTAKQRSDTRILAKIIREAAEIFSMNFSEYSYESVIQYIYVSNSRIRHGQILEATDEEKKQIRENLRPKFQNAAEYIAAEIYNQRKVLYSETEIMYMALQLGGKAGDGLNADDDNIVVSSRINELAMKMIGIVLEVSLLDLRDNLELQMSLSQHLVSFDIRMRYSIFLKNPILDQIRQEYAYAYVVAATACTALKEYYEKDIPEDEIGYFAVIFALAIQKQSKPIRKCNIVMVCISGCGTSRLFMYKYRQIFGKYIDKIYESTVCDLRHMDFRTLEIDYVFTTVPLSVSLPVPVFEISVLLKDTEINTYAEMFENDNSEFLSHYFDRELFLPGLQGKTKEEVLQKMCAWIAGRRQVPADFYELVMKREAMGQTDFGNLVAIPHPYRIVSNEKFVTAAILENPVWWGHHDVQIVFLISLSEEKDNDIEDFYRTITNFFSNFDLVQQVIETMDFSALLVKLKEATRKAD